MEDVISVFFLLIDGFNLFHTVTTLITFLFSVIVFHGEVTSVLLRIILHGRTSLNDLLHTSAA